MSDVVETPPVEPDAPPPAEAAPETPAAEEDAEVAADRAEAEAIEIPTGEKLAPVSAIIGLRQKLKSVKGEADTVKAEKARLEAQLQELAPLAEAFRTLQQQHQQAPPAPIAAPSPAPEDTTRLEAIARQFDFYTADGQPDIARAKQVGSFIAEEASRVASAHVAPLQEQRIRENVASNIRAALATKHPKHGDGVDPGVFQSLVQQIVQQPGGMETLADREAVKQLWLNAYALGSLQGGGMAPVAAVPSAAAPPVVTERAGGAGGPAPVTLSNMERKAMKDLGMSEAEYLKTVAKMPW